MLDLFRAHPVSSVLAVLLLLALAILAFLIGWTVLGWGIRGACWLVPKLDALVVAALRFVLGR